MAKKVDHTARLHSDLPPSSANKWMFCFGWRATVAQHHAAYGRPPSSAAAEEGTAAHEKFERHLLGSDTVLEALPGMSGPDYEAWEDHRVESHRPLSEDDDEFDHLMECVEWVQQQPGALLPESRVDFGEGLGYVGLTGTADITLVEPDRLTIGDLKYGKQLVEVRDERGWPNPQLMCYLVGAINKFGPRPEYRLVILQPRAPHPQGPIRETRVTQAELNVFLFDLENAIEGNYRNNECTPGPWCRQYCDALPSCRAFVMAGRQRLLETPIED